MGWRHSVRALVLDPDDRILLCRHKIPAPQRTVWAAPGGGEAGETSLDALRRELHEEIGLTIEAEQLPEISDYSGDGADQRGRSHRSDLAGSMGGMSLIPSCS
jgi:ADP-ribose pyrophosphatase YjhB (NUDIX family)